MVEYQWPSLTEIGFFIIQVVIFMILWQGYQWTKAKVEISKIKAEKERLILEQAKPKTLQELEDIQKPDSLTEKIQNSLKRLHPKNKETNKEEIIEFG